VEQFDGDITRVNGLLQYFGMCGGVLRCLCDEFEDAQFLVDFVATFLDGHTKNFDTIVDRLGITTNVYEFRELVLEALSLSVGEIETIERCEKLISVCFLGEIRCFHCFCDLFADIVGI
jgi:hypothetical protein